MLIGKKTVLRAIEEDDLESLRIWRNNIKLRRYFREFKEISKASHYDWYKNVVLPAKNTLMFSIDNTDTSSLIGACGLCYIDWVRRSADLSIYIGLNEIYIDQCYSVDAARLVTKYGFEEIGLHRIWAEVYAHDIKKQELFKKLKFKEEGRQRESHWSEGKWIDSIYYSMLSTEFLV